MKTSRYAIPLVVFFLNMPAWLLASFGWILIPNTIMLLASPSHEDRVRRLLFGLLSLAAGPLGLTLMLRRKGMKAFSVARSLLNFIVVAVWLFLCWLTFP